MRPLVTRLVLLRPRSRWPQPMLLRTGPRLLPQPRPRSHENPPPLTRTLTRSRSRPLTHPLTLSLPPYCSRSQPRPLNPPRKRSKPRTHPQTKTPATRLVLLRPRSRWPQQMLLRTGPRLLLRPRPRSHENPPPLTRTLTRSRSRPLTHPLTLSLPPQPATPQLCSQYPL